MPSRRSIENEEDWGEQPALFDTSVEIYRYLVVISPSQEMIAEVARLKSMVTDRIGPFRGDRSIAHMTVLFAYLPIDYEREFMEGLRRGVNEHRSFELNFDGIRHFPDKTSIFIDPIEKEKVIELRKSIRKSLQSNKSLNRLGIHPTTQPMISIARKLTSDRFKQAWQHLAQHKFDRQESVTDVLLLRGSLKEGEKYEVVARSALMPR